MRTVCYYCLTPSTVGRHFESGMFVCSPCLMLYRENDGKGMKALKKDKCPDCSAPKLAKFNLCYACAEVKRQVWKKQIA